MGGAQAAIVGDVTAGFWNPAGLSSLNHKQMAFMHSETFGDLLNHDYIAFASPLGSSQRRTVAAVSLTRLGGGGIRLTEWDPRLSRPIVVKETGHADYQLLLSYSVQSSRTLRLGASAKFIYRDIADNSAIGLGADLGIQFDDSDHVFLGLMVRDVTSSMISYDTGTKESIYPTVIPGFGYRHYFGDFRLLAGADAEVKFENYRGAAQYWQGSISIDTRAGFEVGFKNTAFGRAGSDMGKLALGGGVSISSFDFDIAFQRNTDIDDSFRLSAAYNFR
jgi:hypothetical protein